MTPANSQETEMQFKSLLRSKSPDQRRALNGPFSPNGPRVWVASVREPGDSPADHFASSLCLYEDGVRLTSAHAQMEAIRREGAGRYCHWMDGGRGAVYFS